MEQNKTQNSMKHDERVFNIADKFLRTKIMCWLLLSFLFATVVCAQTVTNVTITPNPAYYNTTQLIGSYNFSGGTDNSTYKWFRNDTLNTSGNGSACYQEYANRSINCGGLNTGAYLATGTWTASGNNSDGNWNTYGSGSGGSTYYYVNYTIPTGAKSAKWQKKTGTTPSTENKTILTTCMTTTKLQIRWQSNSGACTCYNGTTWNTMSCNASTTSRFYEDGIFWNFTIAPVGTHFTNWTFEVTPCNQTSCGTKVNSTTLVISNYIPTVIGVNFTPTTFLRNNILTGNYTFSDLDNDTNQSYKTWFVNGVLNVSNNIKLGTGNFTEGDNVTFQVTPYDGYNNGTALNSTTLTAGGLPAASSISISPGTAYSNSTLTGNFTFTDVDSDPDYSYWYWFVNGEQKASGRRSAGTGNMTLGVGNFSRGNQVIVSIIPNDNIKNGTMVNSSTLTISNWPANITITNPTNNSVQKTNTPTITFESDDIDYDTLSCTLYFNGAAYGTNGSVNVNVTTSIAASSTVSDGVWYFWIGCSDGTTTSVSQNMSLTIDTSWMNGVNYTFEYDSLGRIRNSVRNGVVKRYSYGSNHVHAPTNIATQQPGVTIRQYSELPSTTMNRTFEFFLASENNRSVTGANWTMNLGDGNTVNSTISLNITPGNTTWIIVQYGYSFGGDYNVNITGIASSNSSSSKELPVKFGVRTTDLERIYANGSQNIFDLTIGNDLNQNLTSSINWTCNNSMDGQIPFYLGPLETLRSVLASMFGTAGKKSLLCKTISGDGTDAINLDFNVKGIEIQNFTLTDINVTHKTVSFKVHNYWDSELPVTWNITTSNISIGQTSDVTQGQYLMVAAGVNYSSVGHKIIDITVSSGNLTDSYEYSFNIKGIEIQDYNLYVQNVTDTVISFDVLNYWPQTQNVNWNLSDPALTSNFPVNVSYNNKTFFIVAVNYSTQGIKNPRLYAYSSTLNDSYTDSFANNMIELASFSILRAVQTDTVAEAWLKNNIAPQNVSWQFNTGEQSVQSNVTLLNSSQIYVIVNTNYTNSTAYVTNFTINSSAYSDVNSEVVVI